MFVVSFVRSYAAGCTVLLKVMLFKGIISLYYEKMRNLSTACAQNAKVLVLNLAVSVFIIIL